MVFVTRKCGASYITSDSAARTHGWSGDVRDGCEVGAGSRHQNGLRPKFRGVPPKRLRRFRWQDKGSFELRFDLNRHKAAPLVRPPLLGELVFAGFAAESRPTIATVPATVFGASGLIKLRVNVGNDKRSTGGGRDSRILAGHLAARYCFRGSFVDFVTWVYNQGRGR